MCIDFKDVIRVTENDSYPFSNINTSLDILRKAKYLSKIDLLKDFHQVPFVDSSKMSTAFVLPG